MPTKSLQSEIAPAKGVLARSGEQLYELYASCYDGTDRARFRADLEEKHWVILLREAESENIVGFSTQLLLEAEVNRRTVNALFSGDTIIHPRYWGSLELIRAWCRLAGMLKTQCGDRPLYWFLISKGHRTYLFLPSFFTEFYPRHDRPTPPFERQLIQVLARAKFLRDFNPETGLIRYRAAHDRVKIEFDSAPKRLNNPHVDFFVRRNPGYRCGSELVCVAEISAANMRSVARRELENGMRSTVPLVA